MDEPDKAARTRGMLRDVTETVLLTALIFFAIRAVIQNFKIEGSSMLPTLESGQYVLVNKLAFAGFGEPHRGDIVVFESWSDPEKDYIKRIIGLPGETVEIKDRRVFIDKAPLAEPYLDPPSTSPAYGPLVLGEDEYFVLGDNRGNSSDSRQHDAMSEEQLIGKAWVTYWPPPAMSFVPDGEDSYADGDGTQTGGLEQGDDADSEGSADDEEDNSFFGFGDSFFGEGDERDEGAEGDDVNGDGESDGAQESGDTGDESGG